MEYEFCCDKFKELICGCIENVDQNGNAKFIRINANTFFFNPENNVISILAGYGEVVDSLDEHTDQEVPITFVIAYCPICGKKLSKEEE